MQVYKVHKHQNIFDVAIHIYGSIEGVFDLMADNPDLSYDTQLHEGDKLMYDKQSVIHSDIVRKLSEDSIVPSNGERHVYYKQTQSELRCVINIHKDAPLLKLNISGNGNMIIDWGDNSILETVQMQPQINEVVHFFDNTVDDRIIKIYGDFELKTWNLSTINGYLYLVKPMIVDEVLIDKNHISMEGLFLFRGTYSIIIRNTDIASLDPIKNMSLSYLELKNNEYINESCIDDYLIYIATHHNQRRNCHVVLDVQPSGVYQEPPKDSNGKYIITTGMQAIYVILHEPTWNESGPWIFNINGTIYSAANLVFDYILPIILD